MKCCKDCAFYEDNECHHEGIDQDWCLDENRPDIKGKFWQEKGEKTPEEKMSEMQSVPTEQPLVFPHTPPEGFPRPFLQEIQKELATQNNRATADPIFIVYDWEKVPSCSDYTEEWEYIETDDGGRIGNTTAELIEFASESLSINVPEDCQTDEEDIMEYINKDGEIVRKFYYIKKRVFINVFFTEKAANKFMRDNHYHYTEEVHTYVNCLWRNPEMQTIRNALLKGEWRVK